MFSRYAIYVVPDGPWGDFGAHWLGWDVRTGQEVSFQQPDLAPYTKRPHKYGFHGTIKAPFRLASGQSEDALVAAATGLARSFAPFTLTSLQLSQIGRFFALTAPGEHTELRALADKTVRDLDKFRAPLSDAELQRRRASRLTQRQDEALVRWGYPYVFEDFKFHLTLTGPTKKAEGMGADIQNALDLHFATPLVVSGISVAGEGEDGRFRLVKHCPFEAV